MIYKINFIVKYFSKSICYAKYCSEIIIKTDTFVLQATTKSKQWNAACSDPTQKRMKISLDISQIPAIKTEDQTNYFAVHRASYECCL